jgi:SAM-dependent methyltransferase
MMWKGLRSGLKLILPSRFRDSWRKRQIEVIRRRNRGRAVVEIFTEIYDRNRWGGGQGAFHSGSGSSVAHAEHYGRMVKEFIRSRNVRRVVDLGCGDFRVGAQLLDTGILYTGVDIVPSLVDSNRRRYGSERVRFECLNIIENDLPPGDLCLIRQVLQHLSNEQIGKVLDKVAAYRYVIVTEHYPAPEALRSRNVDKLCGEDVRIYDGSGVYLDAPPFNRSVSGPLLEVDAGHCLMRPGEQIRSYLIENTGPAAGARSSGADGL